MNTLHGVSVLTKHILRANRLFLNSSLLFPNFCVYPAFPRSWGYFNVVRRRRSLPGVWWRNLDVRKWRAEN